MPMPMPAYAYAYALGNKCAKNLRKQTLLVKLIV